MKRIAFITLLAAFGFMTNAQNAAQLLMDALHLSEEGKYKESIELLKKNESIFAQENRLSDMYGSLSWYYLFTKDFTLSEQAVMKALEIDNTRARLKTNLPHALLLQGKTAEAEKFYNELANTIEDVDDTYTATLLNDFEKLEKSNIVPRGIKKDFERIKTDINKIDEAIEIFKRFEDLCSDDKFDEALTLLQPYIATLPEYHAQKAAKNLTNKGIQYDKSGNYDEAEQYYLTSKIIYEKVFGKDHSSYTTSLNNLGGLYSAIGKYSESEKYYLEAKTIYENVMGKNNNFYVASLNNLGSLYKNMGNFSESEKYYLEAKLLRENFFVGKNHPEYVVSLNFLGNLYHNMGNYNEAEKYLLEAKTICKKILDQSHPDYTVTLNNLGALYYTMCNFNEAEKYLLEAKTIQERVLGKEHPNYANSLNNLGELYNEMGNYAEAEKYLLEAKSIQEQVLGKEHPIYANSLNNLGLLYHEMGNYTQAESYILEAKNIREKVFGKEHPDYANVANNLGGLYSNLGDYAQAETFFLEAKNILEKVFGKEHPNYATSVSNLGGIYSRLSDYAKAETYYLEAKNIYEKIFGKEHPNYATSVSNLGGIYSKLSDYAKAETYYLEAKNIFEKVLGKEHPNYSISVQNLRSLYQTMKDYEKAIIYNNEHCGLVTKSVDNNFAFLSEQQRSWYWEIQKPGFIGSYALSWFHPVASIHSLNYNNTLYTKGLLLRTTNDIRDAIYASGNTELISQYERLGNLRTEIGNLQQKENFNRDYVQTLENRADSLDKAITLASQDYRDLKADISMTWQDVQKQLTTDEVAIEFVDFRLYDKQWTDSTMYAALVLRPGMDAPSWIPLCEQQQLESLLRTTVQNSQLQTENLYVDKGEKLYELIWQNLEKELTGVHTIYYSPAGLLYKIAFNALPTDGANALLSDKYNLQLLSSTREIARLKQEKSASFVKEATVVYGGLTYDRRQLNKLVADNRIKQPNEQPSENEDRFVDRFRKRGAELPPADLRAGFSEWQHLPGTKVETEEIVKLLAEKRVPYQYFIEDKGTEESFKELNGTDMKVIFLGTHGFFLADIENKAVENLVQRLGGSREKPFENPLLRSGLIMSGANDQWLAKEYIIDDDSEDGILTADEISRLNLINTKLVVLSACETGLGDVKNSEGVFGLQRAFKLAGVESLIMSLWSVPDRATADLMTTFYELWLSGQTKQSAFKAAQQKVREKYPSPYFWAAFVMMD